MPKFDDPRLVALNGESGLDDSGMRRSLLETLEPDEVALACYSVNAHIWVGAVLTDRALLIVKGALRASTQRMALPLDVVREPQGTKKGVRVVTPIGTKTLWGSRLDPHASLLLSSRAATPVRSEAPGTHDGTHEAEEDPEDAGARLSRGERAKARRQAGRKPRKPRRPKARRTWVGFAPASTIWDISHHCVKCGRALTNSRSQHHRVGTDCIKRYGSQARKVVNPAHAEWTARRSRADVDRIARQAAYDAEFARARRAYDEAVEQWQAVRSGRSSTGAPRKAQ